MKNGLNGFPLDGSMSSQNKYDYFVEKMNTAQRSYNSRHTNTSTSGVVILVGGMFQIVASLIMLLFSFLSFIISTIKKL